MNKKTRQVRTQEEIIADMERELAERKAALAEKAAEEERERQKAEAREAEQLQRAGDKFLETMDRITRYEELIQRHISTAWEILNDYPALAFDPDVVKAAEPYEELRFE